MNVFPFVKMTGLRPRLFTVIAAFVIGITSATAQSDSLKPAPRRPSIVLIIADDLGWGDLGCYGQTNIHTPNLDKLAAEGVRFTSFYGGADSGAASRASILTGRNAAHLGLGDNLLPADATTASQLLKNASYRTGFIGQWGLNDLPESKSFDQVAAIIPETREFDHYPLSLWRADTVTKTAGIEMDFPDNENGRKELYFPDLFTKAGTNFITSNKPEPFNKHRSYFLCLSYNVPHVDLDLTVTGDYAGEKWPGAQKIRAAMISHLDAAVGAIRQRLIDSGQTDNAIIVFMSGNGPDTNAVDPKLLNPTGGLRGGKNTLYEGGIRVPMIVWFPGHIAPTVNDTPYAAWDILPTLADIAWDKPPGNIDGISLWTTLTGQTHTTAHDFLFWEDPATGARAVRMGDWKAISPQKGAQLELYNLKSDPQEAYNVAAQNLAVLTKIKAYLKTVQP